jgi:hypothetical protein
VGSAASIGAMAAVAPRRVSPFASSLLITLMLLAANASAQAAGGKPGKPGPWPPAGPKWETVPAKAFARAREQKKVVMAYVATEGCPHCVVMQRETWPTPEVAAVNDDVVFLAVHRNDDVDWTRRLNVIAYPQTLFLDGWGELLPNGRDHVWIRDKRDLVTAVKKFAGDHATVAAPHVVPPQLLDGLTRQMIGRLANDDCDVRLAAWRELLPKLQPASLRALYDCESDAVARLEAVQWMAKHAGKARDEAIGLATAAIGDGNDYVRQEAITLLAAVGGPQAGKVLADVIDKVLGGRSGYANPNNMLCAATKAAATVADAGMVDSLARVLKQEKANNSATHLAVAALAAIGKKHGKPKVKAALELALEVDGANADRLHAAAKAALQD